MGDVHITNYMYILQDMGYLRKVSLGSDSVNNKQCIDMSNVKFEFI